MAADRGSEKCCCVAAVSLVSLPGKRKLVRDQQWTKYEETMTGTMGHVWTNQGPGRGHVTQPGPIRSRDGDTRGDTAHDSHTSISVSVPIASKMAILTMQNTIFFSKNAAVCSRLRH